MFNISQLTSILAEPPYEPIEQKENIDPNLKLPIEKFNFGTPKKIKKMSQLRAKHIDYAVKEEAITKSPFKKERFSPYGKGHPLSEKSVQFKIENNLTVGRNTSIAVYLSPNSKRHRYTIDSTSGLPGSEHAELKSVDKIPDHVKVDPDNIKIVYSERKPCCKGSNCHCKLKTMIGPNTEVVWSVDHPDDKEKRKEIEADFKQTQIDLGVRDPKKRKR